MPCARITLPRPSKCQMVPQRALLYDCSSPRASIFLPRNPKNRRAQLKNRCVRAQNCRAEAKISPAVYGKTGNQNLPYTGFALNAKDLSTAVYGKPAFSRFRVPLSTVRIGAEVWSEMLSCRTHPSLTTLFSILYPVYDKKAYRTHLTLLCL